MWLRWLLVSLTVGGTVTGAMYPWPTAVSVVAVVLLTGGVILFAVAACARETWAVVLASVLVAAAGPTLLGGVWSRARIDSARMVDERSGLDDRAATVEGTLARDAQVEHGRVRAAVAITAIDGEEVDVAVPAVVSVAGELAATAAGQWTKGRRLRAVGMLSRPVATRNFGLERHWAPLSQPFLAVVSVKSAALVEVVARAPPWTEAFARGRAFVRRRVERFIRPYGDTSAAVALAILLGERASLDPQLVDRMQRAGIYHVMALSGGNVALLLAAVVWLRHVARTARRTWAAGAALLLAFYGGLVSAEPSVVRAIAVAALYVCAAALDVRATPGHVLGVVAMTLVLWDPGAVFDVGAWLTFVATLGLVGLTGALGRRVVTPTGDGVNPTTWERIAFSVVTVATASLCAELALWPLALYAFGQVTFLGLALNLAAIPLMAIVQVAAAIVVVAGESVARVGAWVVHWAVEAVQATALVADAWHWMVLARPAPPMWTMALYYGALLTWSLTRATSVRRAAGVTAIASGAWLMAPHGSTALDPVLTMTVLDVGQGDATVVQFPSGHSLLVDAGGAAGGDFDVGERVVRPALTALGIQRLTYASFSHGDPDHLGGLGAVIRRLRPLEIWEGVAVPGHAQIEFARSEARRVGAGWRRLQTGDVVAFGDVQVRVVHPPLPDWERVRVRNDDSVVLVIRYGVVTFVLPGDIGAPVEAALAAHPLEGTIRIVKAPHHGSRTSSSVEWIRWARPALALVSAGASNRFGHPAPDVVERYESAGAVVLRTDTDGAIRVRTDGRKVRVESVARGVILNLDAAREVSRAPPP